MHHPRSKRDRLSAGLFAVALLATLMAPPAAAAPEPAPPTPGAPLDINAASAEELQALPGIGPAMARRIVAFREEHGPFRRVEDLMRVKGIGEKSYRKLEPLVRVVEDR